ncbi:hypothetical protein FRC00_007938, partial [Tulasnella sp. 408]
TKDQKTQDISDDDRWDAFWMYCRRVLRVYSCQGAYPLDTIKDLSSQMERHFCGPSLLPNLRFISLDVWGNQTNAVELLPIIPAGLRALEVQSETSATVRRILKHLIAIPLGQLSKVSLSHSGDDDSCDTVAKLLQSSRTTLIDLHIVFSPITISGLKQLGSFPGVMGLILVQRGAAIELHEFFDVIASSFPNLRTVEVTADDAITEDVSVTVFEGLAGCRDLQNISLETHRWKKLSRDDVYRFGSWWPSMKRFSLAQFQHYPDQTTNSLEILQEFARVWSRTLRTVSLPFDGAAPLPSPSTVKFKFEKLAELYVGPSYIPESSIENVAEFLRTISPGYLEIVAADVGFEDEDDYAALWEAVKKEVNAEVAVDSNDVPT